ncbi:hypothetical protein ANN_00579 [Periplaneta americana]|uniref:Uncharacterized protein n=1 Tax=Periplaneta americana TaxID=6978 RepID=A0ABQ8TSA6_PERAM|nr:hypothetical protein ANN_00579 [Periplaneta americana]
MAGLFEGGIKPAGSLKAICNSNVFHTVPNHSSLTVTVRSKNMFAFSNDERAFNIASFSQRYCRPFAYVAFRFSPPASIRLSYNAKHNTHTFASELTVRVSSVKIFCHGTYQREEKRSAVSVLLHTILRAYKISASSRTSLPVVWETIEYFHCHVTYSLLNHGTFDFGVRVFFTVYGCISWAFFVLHKNESKSVALQPMKGQDRPAAAGLTSTCRSRYGQSSNQNGVLLLLFTGLLNDAVSTTMLFSVDGIGDSEMMPRIRHRLPEICLTVGENLGKKSNQYYKQYSRDMTLFDGSLATSLFGKVRGLLFDVVGEKRVEWVKMSNITKKCYHGHLEQSTTRYVPSFPITMVLEHNYGPRYNHSKNIVEARSLFASSEYRIIFYEVFQDFFSLLFLLKLLVLQAREDRSYNRFTNSDFSFLSQIFILQYCNHSVRIPVADSQPNHLT